MGLEDSQRRRVVGMTAEELEEWHVQEFAKIHKEAIRSAGLTSDRELLRQGIERVDLVRMYEVLLRNDLGVRMSLYLLEGMDIRVLDLRAVRGLDQKQINHAVGDGTTQLPNYLEVPAAWSEHE